MRHEPLHDVLGIKVGEMVPFDLTPQKMRKHLLSAARYSLIMRNAMNIAHAEGLSGEDLYTVAAFYAVIQAEAMESRLVRYAECSLNVPYILKEPAVEKLKPPYSGEKAYENIFGDMPGDRPRG